MCVGNPRQMFCCRSVKGTQEISNLLSRLRGGVGYLYSSYLLPCHERYMVSWGVPAQLGGRDQPMCGGGRGWGRGWVWGWGWGKPMRSTGDWSSHGQMEGDQGMKPASDP